MKKEVDNVWDFATFAVVYLSFMGLIAFAIYMTGSLWPLLALFAAPSLQWKKD